MERLLELACPGMRECDLAVELNCYMKSLGADDNFLMLCASPHNPAVMPSSNRKIERGDILVTELTPSYEGQFVQICRTVSVGAPRAEAAGEIRSCSSRDVGGHRNNSSGNSNVTSVRRD